MRVVNSSPNWFPGVQNGQPVSVRYTIPITFNITPTNVVDSSAAKTQNTISDESLLTAADPQDDHLVKQVFSAVEIEPSFPRGIEKFIEYTQKSIKKLNGDNYRGKVVITFVVEKDGSLSGIKILKSLNKDAAAIAQEIIKNSPKWNPGMQNGKPVRVQYTLPVIFNGN